jgi:AAHS family 4-hydroxybenzoate transporter-like MFS transporter
MIAQDRPVAGRQWLVLALVLGALVIDGVDTQLLPLVSTLIMDEMHVDKVGFGTAMSAALIGMTLGAGIGGWLGDRFGRKTILVGSTLLFGFCTIGLALAHAYWLLVLLRLTSGFGFGAVAPNGAAMVSEWLPTRLRAWAMALLSITIPLGGLLGGLLVAALESALGWRGCFMACGVGTLAVTALVIAFLPESHAYLAIRGRRDEADALIHRVTGSPPATGAIPAAAQAGQSVLTRANLRLNLATWIAFFCVELIAYGFINWTTVLLNKMNGWPFAAAVQATTVFNASAIGSSLLTGWLLQRFRFRNLTALGCLGAAFAILLLYQLMGTSPTPPSASQMRLVYAGIALVSVLAGIAIAGIYTFVAFAYPAACRASGIGITLMTGRAGGILIAQTGGVLLALQGNSSLPFFATLLGAAVLASLSIWSLGARYAVVLKHSGDMLAPASAGSRVELGTAR